MYTTEYASINPNSIQTGGVATYRFLGDLNGNGKADQNELGAQTSQFVPRSNSIDPNLKDPKNDEIMFAFQREVPWMSRDVNALRARRRWEPARPRGAG